MPFPFLVERLGENVDMNGKRATERAYCAEQRMWFKYPGNKFESNFEDHTHAQKTADLTHLTLTSQLCMCMCVGKKLLWETPIILLETFLVLTHRTLKSEIIQKNKCTPSTILCDILESTASHWGKKNKKVLREKWWGNNGGIAFCYCPDSWWLMFWPQNCARKLMKTIQLQHHVSRI